MYVYRHVNYCRMQTFKIVKTEVYAYKDFAIGCYSFFAVITLLPLVRSDYWTFRILEYPRIQKFFLGIAVLTFCFSSGKLCSHGFCG